MMPIPVQIVISTLIPNRVAEQLLLDIVAPTVVDVDDELQYGPTLRKKKATHIGPAPPRDWSKKWLTVSCFMQVSYE